CSSDLTDDVDVVGAAQHEGQPGPHQRVVVDEKHSDRSHGRYVITAGRCGDTVCGPAGPAAADGARCRGRVTATAAGPAPRTRRPGWARAPGCRPPGSPVR